MISREEVLAIHDILLKRFGGREGIRDEGLLDSAINSPSRHGMDMSFIQVQSIKPQQFLKVSLRITLLLMETKGRLMF
jgi:hypothetical protein